MTGRQDLRGRVEAPDDRLLSAQARILERAVRGDPVLEVLGDLCRLVEDPDAGRWCTVLLIRDGAVQHVAAPNVAHSYTSAIEGVVIGPDVGSCGTAAWLGEPVLVDDIATDPKWVAWRDLALAHGFRACWSYPVRDDLGEVMATFAAYADTSRMPTRAEESLIEFAVRLASVLVSNARWRSDLEEVAARLADANDELVRRDRAKDDLLSVTSHELRTPLTPMHGLLETLCLRWDDLPDGERRGIVDVLRRQCSRLSHLVDDLLTMSVAAAGGLSANPHDVLLPDAVAEAVATVAHDREVHVDVPGTLAVHVDPDHLQQILTNYLSNAVKYAPVGPIHVRARADDGEVRVEVVDQGPGVPRELEDDLFEPFRHGRQANGSTGTGLGLSVVRSLARANAGRAWYRPGDTGGSRFLLALPEARDRG